MVLLAYNSGPKVMVCLHIKDRFRDYSARSKTLQCKDSINTMLHALNLTKQCLHAHT